MCIILIIVITTNTIIKYLIFSSCDSDNYIISKCPQQDLSSRWMSFLHSAFFFFFLNPQGSFPAITLQSHPFHPSAAMAPVIMVPLGCVPAASPVHIRTSSPLSSCPSSAVPSAISGSGITVCHFQSPEVMQQR